MSVDRVEATVCRLYSTIQLDQSRAKDIQSGVMVALERIRLGNRDERRRQDVRIARLKEEGQKLLQAYYRDAVPLELLKSEQDRITKEVADAEQLLAAVELQARDVEETLRLVLGFAAREVGNVNNLGRHLCPFHSYG